MSISVATDASGTVIVGERYRVTIPPGAAQAYLAGVDGTVWTRLELTASVDRIGCGDDRFGTARVTTRHDGDTLELTVTQASSAWRAARTILECRPDDVRVRAEVEGDGLLADVTVLGGRTITPTGAAGVFRSAIAFPTVFVPTPTRPIAFLRSSSSPAQLGVVGDAEPGRLNAVFAPPPFCFAFGRGRRTDHDALLSEAAGHDVEPWLSVHLAAPVEQCGFTALGYEPLDGGFLFRLSYEGHTAVEGAWASPEFVFRPAATAFDAVAALRDDLLAHGWSSRPEHARAPRWWREPIFCGWGAQCAAAIDEWPDTAQAASARGWDPWVDPTRPPDVRTSTLSNRERYDRWLGVLEQHGVNPGTVVIDDRWQKTYGLNDVDESQWPRLREWIAAQHARGRRVLLWFKAWDPSGLPPEVCVRTPDGVPVCADPGNPRYLELLREQVKRMLGPGGLDADGFKVDFTQRGPSGASLTGSAATTAGTWGVAALHALLRELYLAAKAAKPDAMVIAHAMHPAFAGVQDVLRLNDMQERDERGEFVPVSAQARVRRAIAVAALPEHLIDTDQWPMPNHAQWAEYVEVQPELGIPALYYVESIDNSGERITGYDLDRVARSWRDYRDRHA